MCLCFGAVPRIKKLENPLPVKRVKSDGLRDFVERANEQLCDDAAARKQAWLWAWHCYTALSPDSNPSRELASVHHTRLNEPVRNGHGDKVDPLILIV